MKVYYIDGGSLRALYQAGILNDVLANAARNGIDLRTSRTIIEEIRQIDISKRNQADIDFLDAVDRGNPPIRYDSDPQLGSETWSAEKRNIPKDAGEEGLAELVRQQKSQGAESALIMQADRDIRRGREGGGYLNEVSVKSIGDLPGFVPEGQPFPKQTLAPVPNVLMEIYQGNPVAHAYARDELLRLQISNSRDINPKTTFPINADIGVEAHYRVAYGSSNRAVYTLPGQAPEGSGYVSETRARMMRADLDIVRQDQEAKYRETVRNIRDNPASYLPDGNFNPAAARALKLAEHSLIAAGYVLAGIDIYITAELASRLAQSGDTAGAANEMSGLAGRLAGGYMGAKIGFALGGGPVNPVGGLIFGLLGGVAGTLIGDDVLRDISGWLSELFGLGGNGHRDSLWDDLVETIQDMLRRILADPIALDLDGDGLELVALADSNVSFDLDNDGQAERIGWVSAQDGLLFQDANNDGVANGVAELFGSANVDGYDELKLLDSDRNNRIDQYDADFQNLKVWRDLNQNGVSEPDEVLTLAQAGISHFNLFYNQLDAEVAGNTVARKGSYVRTDGSARDMASVWFAMDESGNRQQVPAYTDMSKFYGLPNLEGAGPTADLRTAMYFDPVLKDAVADLANGGLNFSSFADFAGLARTSALSSLRTASNANESVLIGPDPDAPEVVPGRLIEILYRWAGVDTSAPEDSARPWHIQVFEAITGVPLEAVTSRQRELLEEAWPQLVGQVGIRFLIQSAHSWEYTQARDMVEAFESLDPNDPSYVDSVLQIAQTASEAAENPPQLSAFLAPFALLNLDPQSGKIIGDFDAFARAFTGGEPPAGKGLTTFGSSGSYGPWLAWYQNHGKFLFHVASAMDIGSDYVMRVTGWRWMFGSIGTVEGTTGDDILEQPSSANTTVLRNLPNGSIELSTSSQPTRDQALYGYAGNDELRGHDGVDRLVGGIGDDRLVGGSGGDMYVYASGDGLDRIIDESGDDDVIYFSSELRSENLLVTRLGDTSDLLVHFGDPASGVILTGQWSSSQASIEHFHFVGQHGLTADDIAMRYLATLVTNQNDRLIGSWASEIINGREGDDILDAGAGNDAVYGGAGDDTIIAGVGSDTLIGGVGDDHLKGDAGADTYVYSPGDGADVIEDISWSEWESGVIDTLVFGDGITADDLVFSNVANNWDAIRIGVQSQGGFITIQGQHRSDSGIEAINFADGTSWNLAQLTARYVSDQQTQGDDLIHGSNWADNIAAGGGNDIIVAGAGNDTLIGGWGDDHIKGDDGADTYVYSLGDGVDVIEDLSWSDWEGGVIDTLVFGAGITTADVVFSNVANDWDAIRISLRGQPGSIISKGQHRDERGLEAINFADGTSWNLAQLTARYVSDQQTQGDDLIHGSNWADNIIAGVGDDMVVAGGGNDTLFGGMGDDYLKGDNGADTYLYNLGDGVDVIEDLSWSDWEGGVIDTLVLGAGIAADDLVFSNVGLGSTDLRISFANDEGAIVLRRQSETSSGIERVLFADGTSWDLNTLTSNAAAGIAASQPTPVRGTSGADHLDGTSSTDAIYGGAGDDRLTGNAGVDLLLGEGGNDTLRGGAGHDHLAGGEGNDTYLWARGDGSDVIYEGIHSGTADTVFLESVAPDAVALKRSGNDFILKVTESFAGAGDGGTITLSYSADDYYSQGIEQVRFADGTVWTRSAMRAMWLTTAPTTGADIIFGFNTNDALRGGAGYDHLSGGEGNDTYIWTRGDGSDTISDGVHGGSTDTLHLDGVNPAAVTLRWSDNNFILKIAESVVGAGDGGTIKLNNSGDDYYNQGVEQVSFGDGTIWTRSAMRAMFLTGAPTIGADIIFGFNTNDTLRGGAGYDHLSGGEGDDTYIWTRGDGSDIISEGVHGGTADTLVLEGIAPEAVTLKRSGNNFLLKVAESAPGAGDGGTITMNNSGDDYYSQGVEQVRFADGTIWTRSVMRSMWLDAASTTGADIIAGFSTNDTLRGGAGHDQLSAGEGNDHLWGDAGDDKLSGSTGYDASYYAGDRASHLIRTGNGTVQVVDNASTADGDDGTDTIASIEQLVFKNGETASVASPIILDLGGDGVETVTAAKSNARFDLDGDGLADNTSWIGTGDAFLYLDRDGNGTVSGIGEISFIDDVEGAASDLAGLRAFDSNNDGKLDAADARFTGFGVWRDADGDGAVDEGETASLAAAGIRSIGLTGTAVNATSKLGEVAIVNTGSFTLVNGQTRQFADAALTYFSAASNLPEMAVTEYEHDRKASKYRLNIAGGAVTLMPKRGRSNADPLAGQLGANTVLTFKGRDYGMFAPVVLDLDGDGVELVKRDKTRAAFDYDGNGAADDTGWVKGDDGFLVIDRNRDGLITDASELSLAAERADARSGLQGLAALDSNSDGIVDSKDARFGELSVWRDRNGDGRTDAGELVSLKDAGIAAIRLGGVTAATSTVKLGSNALVATTSFVRTDGTTATAADVSLAYRPAGNGTAANAQSLVSRVFGSRWEAPRIVEAADIADEAAAQGADAGAQLMPHREAVFDMLREGREDALRGLFAPMPYLVGGEAPAWPEPEPDVARGAPGVQRLHLMPEERAAIGPEDSANPAPPPAVDSAEVARKLALIRQDLSVFGARGFGEANRYHGGHAEPADWFS